MSVVRVMISLYELVVVLIVRVMVMRDGNMRVVGMGVGVTVCVAMIFLQGQQDATKPK